MRRLCLLSVVAFIAVACIQPAGAAVTFPPGDPWKTLPLDPSITPVSKSNPSDHARRALDSCGFTAYDPDHPGSMMNIGIDAVGSMGLVQHGFDAAKYAPLGQLAELDRDDPIWVINSLGVIELTLGPTVRNATCIVYDGNWDKPYWVGGDTVENGVVVESQDPQPRPVLHLPPLAP